MTMPNLYKQNTRQWIAIACLFLALWIEYQARIDLQAKVEQNYWELITTERSLAETAAAKLAVKPSCLVDVPVKPKHKNHQH